MFTLLVISLFLVPADDSHWPGFLGDGRTPIDPATLPLRWSPTENIAWTAALPGHGQSSPVIFGDLVCVTSVEGPMKDENIITALNLTSGEVVWQKRFPSSDPVKSSTFVSRAAPTPVADAAGVIAYFESGDLVALTREGTTRWAKSLADEYGRSQNTYGLGASPVQTDDCVFLLVDHQGPSYVICLNKADGSVKWKTDRTSRASWSSPRIQEIAGQRQLLCSSAGTIDGYDLTSGIQLWTHEGVGGNRICTPFPCGDGSFLVGSQTSREFPDVEAVKKSNFRMTVRKDADKWVPSIDWRTEEASPGMASPIVCEDTALWINRTGAVFSYDAATGEKLFTERIRQSCWATPVGVGDRVYFFGKDGVTTVLKSGRTFEVLAENTLWDPESIEKDTKSIEAETDPVRKAAAAMHAAPEVYGVAVVNGRIVIRTGAKLFCVAL